LPTLRVLYRDLQNRRSIRAARVATRKVVMCHLRLLVLAAALAASASAAQAGPCAQQIDLMQARFDAKLAAAARSGPTARESVAATDSRQPTPDSIAAAEAKLGDISPGTVEVIEAGMARARKADMAGDKSACEQALADVQRTIGP
jgi:hypothetical protein